MPHIMSGTFIFRGREECRRLEIVFGGNFERHLVGRILRCKGVALYACCRRLRFDRKFDFAEADQVLQSRVKGCVGLRMYSSNLMVMEKECFSSVCLTSSSHARIALPGDPQCGAATWDNSEKYAARTQSVDKCRFGRLVRIPVESIGRRDSGFASSRFQRFRDLTSWRR